ncbi:hypothetical protein [Kribbella italica]|uniref:Uncharacterized protein n=1 Tax=Kribbella italica TaxID=1540520 RepID=A0A7W9MUF2_9ACTN|nr:hypothetical protein [Kribbella italica]MBB5836776.1 hypothetical protein [Kribbella italica]
MTTQPSSPSLRSEASEVVQTIAFPLILVITGLGLILMPNVVGADWPGWSSTMVLVVLLVVPAAFVLTMVAGATGRVVRWIAVIAVLACGARVVWSLYDARDRAAFTAIALAPFLLLLIAAVLLIAYSWPRATTRALVDTARANGWHASRELPQATRQPAHPSTKQPADLPAHPSTKRPADLPAHPSTKRPADLPAAPLPLPIGRFRVVRNVVQAEHALAFEVRWLEGHGILFRRRRLSVFVGRQLQQELPALEVRPGSGLTRSDLSLESAEFNRSYDVIGEQPPYLMAVLHPRVMQTLLDNRPLGLVVDRDVLLTYQETGLNSDSLQKGMATIHRLNELMPQHVYDQWGIRRPAPSSSSLRFAGRAHQISLGKLYLRWLALSTGLLGVTLATCLAGAAAEAHANQTAFTPARSLTSLLIAAVVLGLAATISGLASRPRLAHGSASA